jgi:hypothetical protein
MAIWVWPAARPVILWLRAWPIYIFIGPVCVVDLEWEVPAILVRLAIYRPAGLDGCYGCDEGFRMGFL